MSHIAVETLDHLGIVAGLVNKLDLVARIDARLPVSKEKGAVLTHGQRIKAMIINGLGFTQHPLYLSAYFFEGKALSRLFGEGVDASHFNDDALARTLDVCYDYGTTDLLAEIAAEFFPPKGRDSAHIDTSSISLCGDYDIAESSLEGEECPPLPRYGYSKDHRPDLKQLVLSLTVSGPANLPLWYEGLDDNSQDKENFHQTLARIKAYRQQLEHSPEFIWVADAALYTQGKLLKLDLLWLTRVPETLNRFIKDPLFHLSSIYLKTLSRIDALMMVMTLCLMVYNAGQF